MVCNLSVNTESTQETNNKQNNKNT